jgi:hypothetical protein
MSLLNRHSLSTEYCHFNKFKGNYWQKQEEDDMPSPNGGDSANGNGQGTG